MKEHEAINLLEKTFGNNFDLTNFTYFLKELLKNKFNIQNKNINVASEFEGYIKSFKKIGEYKIKNVDLEVLAVELKKVDSLERARTMQRNFVAKWLNNSIYPKDGALVAFYGENPEDWRFSFVKMNYKINEDRKVSKELTPAKRHSFLVGKNEPNHTCKKQFLNLLLEEEISPSLEDLEKSFSVENVTKIFFEEYRNLFIQLTNSLEKIKETNSAVKREFDSKNISIEEFGKKLLGQIVFLYFLQKKGWLGVKKDKNEEFNEWGTGPKDFMKRLFKGDIVKYKNFFNDVLEPLFYEALNTPRDNNYYSRFECKIPFLNGGLFEPINNYSWTETNILIDNNFFAEIFKTFDEFNFTIKEDEPLEKEVAIDPEMLGKVFENLLEIKDKKSKGAFYTPREIVHYMCQQSLINYLETNTKISREDLEKFVQKGDLALDYLRRAHEGKYVNNDFLLPPSIYKNVKELNELLKEIKVCDPAVGSGAFLVGMMNEIIKARQILGYFLIEKPKSDYDLKRETIENCLYGVDLMPSAVDICKLRFWLSLIVDEVDMRNIKPLPNLDNKVMCGNSLIEEFEGVKLFDGNLISKIENKKEKQTKLSKKTSEYKLEILQKLQKEFFNEESRDKKNRLREEINKIEWEFIELTLKEQKNEEAIRKLNEYKSNKQKPFFLWKLYFSDVFNRKNPGFDIVIANPPYVDSEAMVKNIPKEREVIASSYKTAKGNWDLYIPFFELAFNNLKTRGVLTFITPNKWLSIGYGKELRNFFAKNIIILCNCDSIKVFEAGNTPEIVFIKREESNNPVNLHSFNEDYTLSNKGELPRHLFKEDNWGMVLSKNLNLLLKILAVNKKIKEYCTPENPFTVSEAYTLKNYIYEGDKKNKENDFKLINTGTIDKYISLWGFEKTAYIKDKYQFPYIRQSDFKKNLPKRFEQSKSTKIIISGIRYFECFLDKVGGYVAGKSTIIIRKINPSINILSLLAILNSKLISFFIQESFSATGIGGGVNFTAPMIEGLPCPVIKKEEAKKMEELAEQITKLTAEESYNKDSEKQAMVKALKKRIDKVVYTLYELTSEEIETIEDFNKKEK